MLTIVCRARSNCITGIRQSLLRRTIRISCQRLESLARHRLVARHSTPAAWRAVLLRFFPFRYDIPASFDRYLFPSHTRTGRQTHPSSRNQYRVVISTVRIPDHCPPCRPARPRVEKASWTTAARRWNSCPGRRHWIRISRRRHQHCNDFLLLMIFHDSKKADALAADLFSRSLMSQHIIRLM